jgi:hypothetical protein
MATHDHDMVRRFGRRIAHIEHGEIVRDSGTQSSPFIRRPDAAPPGPAPERGA